MPTKFAIVIIILLFTSLGAAADATGSAPCGSPYNVTPPPYDYNDGTVRDRIKTVERFHFDSGVETLTKGLSSEDLRHDIDFTLRHVPNHHRGLYAAARHELRDGTRPEWRSAECYFSRAIQFRPGDAVVRMIYGIFLARRGDTRAAIDQYQEARALGLNSPELHYNLGLAFVDSGEHDLALEHATLAYNGGFPLPGLREKLAKVGVWPHQGVVSE